MCDSSMSLKLKTEALIEKQKQKHTYTATIMVTCSNGSCYQAASDPQLKNKLHRSCCMASTVTSLDLAHLYADSGVLQLTKHSIWKLLPVALVGRTVMNSVQSMQYLVGTAAVENQSIA